MKLLCTSIVCCISYFMCYAQEMTLQECIKKGIENNLSLSNARIDIDKSKTGITQNRSRLLPVINGVAQFTDYLKEPVNVTTGTLLGNSFSSNPTWQTIKSMQYNVGANIQMSMPVYNKTIYADVNVTRAMEKLKTLTYEKAVEDLTMQISRTYYMAQALQEQKRLTNENILRMEELCGITEALYNEGVVLEVDLNRVRINLKNLNTQYDQNCTLYNQQLNVLRFIMDMAIDTPFEVTHISGSAEIKHTAGVSECLPEILLSAQNKVLAEQRIKSVRAGYMPTFSLLGNVGVLGYQEKFCRFFHTKAASDNWFANSYIGLSVKIPVFDANYKKLQIKRYRYDAQLAANNMELMKKQIQEYYANAILQLNHNMEVLNTQSENRHQAEEVYNVTKEQYKEGIASMTALLQDEMQLRTAQTACIQALCQCRLAQLELLKLSGNLSQLSR